MNKNFRHLCARILEITSQRVSNFKCFATPHSSNKSTIHTHTLIPRVIEYPLPTINFLVFMIIPKQYATQ